MSNRKIDKINDEEGEWIETHFRNFAPYDPSRLDDFIAETAIVVGVSRRQFRDILKMRGVLYEDVLAARMAADRVKEVAQKKADEVSRRQTNRLVNFVLIAIISVFGLAIILYVKAVIDNRPRPSSSIERGAEALCDVVKCV